MTETETETKDIERRVDEALSSLETESGMALVFRLGQERTARLRNSVVSQIVESSSDNAKFCVPAYLHNTIVHENFGDFVSGFDGKLKVRVRE